MGLLSRTELLRWALLIPLGMLSALLEAAASTAILVLASLLTQPASSVPLPGRLGRLLPIVSLGDSSNLLPFLALVALLFLIKAGVTFLTIVYHSRLAVRDQAAFAAKMFRGYMNLPYLLNANRHSTDFAHRTRESVHTVFSLIIWHTMSIARQAMSIIGLLLVLVFANPVLTTTVGVVAVGWLAIMTWAFRHYYVRLGQRSDQATRAREHVFHEALGALQEVQLLGREQYFTQRFARLERDLIDVHFRDASAATLPRVINETVFVLAMVALLAFASRDAGRMATILPMLGLYAYAGMRLLPSANSVVDSINQINGTTDPLHRLLADYELIEHHARSHRDSASQIPPFTDRVIFEGVGFRYPGANKPVLADVTIEIRRGEFVAIIGATGSGKSTLLGLLAGILSPHPGRISIDGRDLATCTRAWQRRLALIPQSPFFMDASIRDNIGLGLERDAIETDRLEHAIEVACLDSVLRGLPDGVDTPIGQNGRRLSGGQRQRVAIARAVYSDPDVLLFDEPTSALDPEAEAEVLDFIRRLRGRKTIVVISHRPEISREADRVIRLDENHRVTTTTP